MVALVVVVPGRNASEDAAGWANQKAQKLAAFTLLLKNKENELDQVHR